MSPRSSLLLSPVFVACLILPAQAQERRPAPPERPVQEAMQRERAPQRAAGQAAMGDSIRYIRSSTRGQVIGAERLHTDGREINRIKVMDERGRVRVYEDDPAQRLQRVPARPTRRDDE